MSTIHDELKTRNSEDKPDFNAINGTLEQIEPTYRVNKLNSIGLSKSFNNSFYSLKEHGRKLWNSYLKFNESFISKHFFYMTYSKTTCLEHL